MHISPTRTLVFLLIAAPIIFGSAYTNTARSAEQFAKGATTDDLFATLQQGGFVVYLRHADTTGQLLDRTMDLTDRKMQRNLSEEGRLQAQAIGEAVVSLDIKPALVLASPVFRARDTAELAFGADNIFNRSMANR